MTTTKNYIQMDPLTFLIPNFGYMVSALDANGVVHTTTPVYPNEAPPGENYGIAELYQKKCNGRTYAYEIRQWAHLIPTGGVDPLTGLPAYSLGNKRLSVNDTYQYYNPEIAAVNYYWQPISSNGWSLYGSGHPYKAQGYGTQQITLNGELINVVDHPYKKVQIDYDLVNNHGPFIDASGAAVTNGFLVEKKMDQFSYMAATPTIATSSAELAANAQIQGWIDFYNSYHAPWSVPATNGFNVPTTSALACVNAYGPVIPGSDEGTGEQWHDWYTDLIASVADAEADLNGGGGMSGTGGSSWDEFATKFNALKNTPSPDNEMINGVALSSVSFDGANAYFNTKNSNGVSFDLVENNGRFNQGLYNLMLFTPAGDPFLTYFELTNEIQEAKLKDFVTVQINPNPVTNDLLKIDFMAMKDVQGQLYVHNLNGDLIVSKSISLLRNIALSDVINIASVASPMFQLRVSVVFNDGSIIQQTASTVTQ